MFFGGLLKPPPAMIQALLMNMGIEDPAMLGLVERLVDGQFTIARPAAFDGAAMPVPDGAKAYLITGTNGTEEVSVLMTYRQLPKKTVDTGGAP